MREHEIPRQWALISPQELDKGQFIFRMKIFGHMSLDNQVSPFLDQNIQGFRADGGGWLKRARLALQISAATAAAKRGISSTAWIKFEENERRGTVEIRSLAMAAEALDCELVYAIRPKARKTFSDLVWETILPEALAHPALPKSSEFRRAERLAAIAGDFFEKTKFRQKHGWSPRRERVAFGEVIRERQFLERQNQGNCEPGGATGFREL